MTRRLLPLLLTALAACETQVFPEGPSAEGHFPLAEGRSWTYALDTIHYREIGGNDTARWWLLDRLGAPYTDLTGGTSFPVERYRRADTSLPWRYFATATVRWSAGQLQWSDNNLGTVRLVDPPRDGLAWQGHLPIADLSTIPVAESCNNWRFLEDWTYAYENLDGTWSGMDRVFDSVLTVTQAGEQNLIEHNDGLERFAPGVGMVERSFRHLTTQTICPECPWEEKAECGFAVTQRLVAYTR